MNDEELWEPDLTNHAVLGFRALLWIAPSAVIMASAWRLAGMNSHRFGIDSRLGTTIRFLVSAAFIIGTGYFNAALSPRSRETWHGMRNRVILFVLIQPFIIPFFFYLIIGWIDAGESC